MDLSLYVSDIRLIDDDFGAYLDRGELTIGSFLIALLHLFGQHHHYFRVHLSVNLNIIMHSLLLSYKNDSISAGFEGRLASGPAASCTAPGSRAPSAALQVLAGKRPLAGCAGSRPTAVLGELGGVGEVGSHSLGAEILFGWEQQKVPSPGFEVRIRREKLR